MSQKHYLSRIKESTATKKYLVCIFQCLTFERMISGADEMRALFLTWRFHLASETIVTSFKVITWMDHEIIENRLYKSSSTRICDVLKLSNFKGLKSVSCLENVWMTILLNELLVPKPAKPQ